MLSKFNHNEQRTSQCIETNLNNMPTIFFKHLQLYCTLCQHLEFENIFITILF